MNDRSEITWSPRISLAKIRELYLQEARGDCDVDLIEEVGFGLYARCAAIQEFTEACAGRVRCKRCAAQGKTTLIERTNMKPAALLRCPVCGWQVRWRVYKAESERVDGQLTEGHAGEAFRRYLARWPQCTSREEKILAIDRLIHEFHWILLKDQARPAQQARRGQPAAREHDAGPRHPARADLRRSHPSRSARRPRLVAGPDEEGQDRTGGNVKNAIRCPASTLGCGVWRPKWAAKPH